jgi:ribosomal protein S12 methylthiotransferase accessory factor
MSNASLSLGLLDASPPPPLGEALKRAARLVSDRVGIISEVVFLETTAEEPAVYWAQSYPAELGPVCGRATVNHGNATSIDADRATMKAAGESIERYCSAFYDEDALVFDRYDSLAGAALRPEDFALFSARQYEARGFPFAPFNRQTRVRWTRGHSLLKDCATWVPASLVYIPYDQAPGEPVLDDLISTGLACGTSYASALLKALSEVVERDAYMIAWRNRLSCPHVDLDSVADPFISRLVQRFRLLQIEMHAVLLTLDLPIAVFLIVMKRSDHPPWTIVASGASLSPRYALGLALEEACLAFIGMSRDIADDPDFRSAAGYADVTTMRDHGRAHALDLHLRSVTEFLTRPTEVVRLDDLPDRSSGNPVVDLRIALDLIGPHVPDVVGIDVTTPDVNEAGFKVVRVVVPGLQPMDIDHRCRHLGGRRLYEVPHRLGRATRRADEDTLNHLPHPFP